MTRGRSVDGRTRNNWLVVGAILLGAIPSALSGIYFLFIPSGGYQGGRNPLYGVTVLFEREGWHDIHTWASVLMVAAIAVHFVLHWSWVRTMSRRVWLAVRTPNSRLSRGSRINVVVDVVVAVSFLLTALSGIYFLFTPAGGFQGGRNIGWDPMFLFSRTTWDLIHTWAGATLIAASTAHLWIHWRWVANVSKRVVRSLAPQPGLQRIVVEADSSTYGTHRTR